MAQHADLTGAELHEPKGVAAANANEVYRANGASSGTWTKLNENSVDSSNASGASDVLKADGANNATWTTVNNLNKIWVTCEVEDISTAGSHWVVIPLAGNITNIWSVIDGTTATANAVLTFEIGGTVIQDNLSATLELTIATGSAAGDVDTAVGANQNTVTAGQPLEIITNGASTNTVKARLTIEVDIS